MSVAEKITKDPLSWKEIVGGALMLSSLAGIFVQGGMILEQQRATNQAVEKLTDQVANLKDNQSRLSLEISERKGIDALHTEQISNMRREIERRPTK